MLMKKKILLIVLFILSISTISYSQIYNLPKVLNSQYNGVYLAGNSAKWKRDTMVTVSFRLNKDATYRILTTTKSYFKFNESVFSSNTGLSVEIKPNQDMILILRLFKTNNSKTYEYVLGFIGS